MKVATEGRPVEIAERLRSVSAGATATPRRAALGQFFTPAPVAQMIASMLGGGDEDRVRLLDPGAGTGCLAAAAVEHFAARGLRELEIVAWEIDLDLHPSLCATLEYSATWAAEQGLSVRWSVCGGDYIQDTASAVETDDDLERFDAVIMNPPYRKVNGQAGARLALERIGLPITNLYTAFLALAAMQLVPGGVLAAITPRSFANGPYAAPFRRFFFGLTGVERLHLFESRRQVFADSGVLQENVIFSVRRGERPRSVRLSFSDGIADVARIREAAADEIVQLDDPQLFLRIPRRVEDVGIAATMAALPASLESLDIAVSTGRVVEFRAREHLRRAPAPGTVPLLRPNHFGESGIHWPDVGARERPNALAVSPASEKLLLPNETYVLVKRMTSKEERRRVRAAVSDPSAAPGPQIAFENHLNVFHRENRGLPPGLARGLAAFLNSSLVDCYVRQFNGHTQINATDLRHLRYPDAESLSELGATLGVEQLEQEDLDRAVEEALHGSVAPLVRSAA
ncbi:MAG TPA: N-6 DNA methylase [Solirubrobacterales bacterium]|nr:N-6 DNA methylase [Solirubrobacterales bacterium]